MLSPVGKGNIGNILGVAVFEGTRFCGFKGKPNGKPSFGRGGP